MVNEYLTVKSPQNSEYTVEKSRFIGYANRVETEEEAKDFVQKIKKQNSLATHNCYAYIVGENGSAVKFSDDGEPQGTAGMPILEVLKNKNLRNVCVVVTRYFGGIKLGAGGLVRAYTKATTDVLSIAEIIKICLADTVKITVSYDLYKLLQKFLSGKNLNCYDQDFGDVVSVKINVKTDDTQNFIKEITEYFNGKVVTEITATGYMEL